MNNHIISESPPGNHTIWVDAATCILCYACVRECPVMAIEVKSNIDHVTILPNRCIACGSCYTVCPTRAVCIASDLNQVKETVSAGKKSCAIIDPCISAEFPDITDYRNFVGMIRALGFEGVYDLSFAVDLSAQAHAALFNDFNGKYRISSKCPAVVSFIEKHYPQLTENLAPIYSPASIMAGIIRKLEPDDPYIVLINPCLASRLELGEAGDQHRIDAQISFPEVREWFSAAQISENSVEFSDFNPPNGRKGALFPLSSGFLQAADQFEDLMESNFFSTDGRQDMINAIEAFSTSYDIRKHLDLFYCEGCIMGPQMSPNGHKFRRRTLATDYATKRFSTFDAKEWHENLVKFSISEIDRQFKPDNQQLREPDETEINDILQLIGKNGNRDTDRGCLACGYKSCREFAIAVALGLAKAEMCHLYGTKNKQEYIKSLRSTNEQLAKAKKALQESEKTALTEKQLAQEYSETLTAVLQKIPSGVVIVNENMRIIQANREFIEILGDEIKSIDEVIPGLKGADLRTLFPPHMLNLFTFVLQNSQDIMHKDISMNNRLLNLSVFPIKKGSILGAVLRDLSLPEVQKEEVIKKVTEVIDKNLEMVQKIGFLLGEGASDTEKMLNSIIKYYRADETK
ncbi:MAG: [Fe-Fe] hydrogenase large subunit C-terminal domain-containing protein [Bacteroidales bacterium]|nr:[Fe-Fe] hydrogenase large subunit C-terminal domain-containing protein [Bacteroidales bacterium]